ncbi:MAG: hypothetical protein QXU63_05620 [Nitrososphaerota archaeon]
MFHGSCRNVSRVLSIALELISKSTVHELSKKFSSIVKFSQEPKIRRYMAVNETKLKIKEVIVHIRSVIEVYIGEMVAVYASRGDL